MDKRYIATLLIFFMFPFGRLAAQEQLGVRERAKKHYNQFEYYQAALLFQRLADSNKPFLQDFEYLADCYLKLKDYEAAETWFSRIITFPKSKPENLVRYGEVLKANLKYEEAKKQFNNYAKITGNQVAVANAIAGCDSSLKWISTPTTHQVINEASVNTALSEFSVFPYKGKVYYAGEPDLATFRSIYGRTGRPYLRLYLADISPEANLLNPDLDRSNLNNGTYHVGPLIADKSGEKLYITRTTTAKALEVSEIDKVKYITNNLELYLFSKQSDGSWKESPFLHNNVEKYSVGHAALSPDEKILYFTSNMEGSIGGTDIWFSEMQSDGTWGKPQNAGPSINTDKDEMFPFVAKDGTLYFSSNGWPGMGGLDIFSATGAKKQWSSPKNLKYPLNSSADDFGIYVSENSHDQLIGYLSSNRKGGKGADDIYSFRSQEQKVNFAVKGKVVDKKNGQVLSGASLSLTNIDGTVVARQTIPQEGTFFFDLEKDKDYTLLASKEKFYGDTLKVSTKSLTKSDTLFAQLQLETLFEVGRVFELKNINYDFDKDNIRPDAAKILDHLVVLMRDNPTLEIELGSHTDSRGNDNYNLNLSQRRAQSVVNYLVTKGISRARMVAKGYGETELLNECGNGVECNDAQHQENRRTVFKVLRY